jgi:hypothetical protein
MKRMRALIVFLVAAFPAAALAQPYKCVGPDGKVTFSDQKCETDRPKVKDQLEDKGPSAEVRERLKALDAITTDKTANNEQKTAALLEASNIRRNLEGQLSADDKAKRGELTRQLGDKDQAKRAQALRELRSLYKD